MENHNSNDPKDPASFLSSIIGVPVTVKLNSGVVYKGELQSVDGYMNIALEKCQEFVNGQFRRDYGDAFVRGNNGELHMLAGNNRISEDCWLMRYGICSAVHFERMRGIQMMGLRSKSLEESREPASAAHDSLDV